MKYAVRALLLFALCVTAPAIGHAAAAKPETVTLLTCTFMDSTVLKVPVYAYNVGTTPGSSRFFTVYTDAKEFNAWAYYEYFAPSGFRSCVLASVPDTYYVTSIIEDVTLTNGGTGVALDAKDTAISGPKREYVGVTFSYQVFQIGSFTSPSAPAVTAEEKAAALRAYKAQALPAAPKD